MMVFRLKKDNRLCLCPNLLPLIFLFTFFKYETFSVNYLLNFRLVFGSWLLTNVHLWLRPRSDTWLLILVSTGLSIAQTWLFGNPWSQALVYQLHSLVFVCCIKLGPKAFPRSFSRCESLILSQGLSLIITHSTACFVSLYIHCDTGLCSDHFPTKTLQVLCFGTLMILVQPALFKKSDNNFVFNVYASVGACCAFVYGSLWRMMGSEPITWLIHFLFNSEKRVQLMQLWICCILVCVLFAALFAACSTSTANTIVRKFYHVVIIMIFCTGSKFDLNLLHFTSGSALILLLLIEMIRISKLPPLGASIERSFQQFRDEKDIGPLTLTHIYLLIGFSLPLWIVPKLQTDFLIAAGLITIGFGDTFASFVGYTCGKHRWPNSKKTYEGTMGALFAQIAGALLYCFYVNIPIGNLLLIKFVLISIIIALIEAVTKQIDNLILPLYFHLFWLILECIPV